MRTQRDAFYVIDLAVGHIVFRRVVRKIEVSVSSFFHINSAESAKASSNIFLKSNCRENKYRVLAPNFNVSTCVIFRNETRRYVINLKNASIRYPREVARYRRSSRPYVSHCFASRKSVKVGITSCCAFLVFYSPLRCIARASASRSVGQGDRRVN